jgi:hypothetical protein
MSIRRSISLIVLSNIVCLSILGGLFYASGLASAAPGARDAAGVGAPPITFQFPLYQTAEDLKGDSIPSFGFAPPQVNTIYTTYSAVAFQPKTSNGVKTADALQGCIYADNTVTNNPVTEPLTIQVTDIPQGSIITEVRGYWRKGQAGNPNLEFDLKRTNMLGVVDNVVQPFYSNNTGGVFTSTAAIITQTVRIDYSAYAYYLQIKLNYAGSGVRTCGMRIGYQYGYQAVTPYISK